MQDLVDRINTAKKKISELIQHVDLAALKEELSAAQKESENTSLWDEPEKAQKLMKKINDLQAEISGWDQLSQKAADVMELAEMDDEAMRDELESEIHEIESECDKKEISTLLSGKFDRGNAILAIHAGAGGTEAHDWASPQGPGVRRHLGAQGGQNPGDFPLLLHLPVLQIGRAHV